MIDGNARLVKTVLPAHPHEQNASGKLLEDFLYRNDNMIILKPNLGRYDIMLEYF